MSNPFASDEYGRPTGSLRNIPPDSSKHGVPQAPYVPEDTSKNRRMDSVVLGLLSIFAVLLVFGLLVVMIMNISPNAPIRLTPDPGSLAGENQETEGEAARGVEETEPQILGD